MSNKRFANRVPLPVPKDDGISWVAIFVLLVVPGYPVTQLIALGLWLSKMRTRKAHKNYERMRHILNIVGDKPYISLRAITKITGRPRTELVKQLNEMIGKGYLGSEAYIDHSKDALIIERAYEDSVKSQRAPFGVRMDFDFDEFKNIASDIVQTIKESFSGVYNSSSAGDAAYETDFVKDEPAAESPKTEEKPRENGAPRKGHQDILDKLKILNDQILDDSVSRKIDRISQLTDNIYEVVEQNPSRAGEVRKFMNYYLPTTIKLLGSYAMLERQTYQGENIIASRRNIEEILDTLVHAFEKQLDRLFAAEAVDISSDIKVLETMIAKDGLTQQAMQLKL